MTLSRNYALLILTAVLATISSCRTTNPEASKALSAEPDNTDIQVISVKYKGTITFGSEAGKVNYLDCNFTDTEVLPSRAQGARADCTSAIIKAKGMLMVNRYVEPEASYRGNPGSSSSFRHWCTGSEVTVAIKKSAYESSNFQGVGFFGRDNIINNANDNQKTFYPKSSSFLKSFGTPKKLVKEGNQEVLLFKFFAAGPCEISGTGRNPTTVMEFKPYVSYDGFIERWENVPNNHGIRYAQDWDRSSELLAP